MKKYEFTGETQQFLDKTLHRIRYLVDIPMYDVKAGNLGGWIEDERNLLHDGNCCVLNDGAAIDNSVISDNACVSDNGVVDSYARICDSSKVIENSVVSDHGCVSHVAVIKGHGMITGCGCVMGKSIVSGHGVVSDKGIVSGNSIVTGRGRIDGNSVVLGDGLIQSMKDIMTISGAWNKNKSATFYRTQSGCINVHLGGFTGTLEEFRERVRAKHRKTALENEYLTMIDLAEVHFRRVTL